MQRIHTITRKIHPAGLILMTAFLLASFFVVSDDALAAKKKTVVVNNVSGWGWSESIGWVSFNCKTGGPTGNDICSTVQYGVNVTDGTPPVLLSGQAWSDRIGWITFDSTKLGSCPPGHGACTARFDGNKLSGWARACSMLLQPSSCSGAFTPNSQNGNWDGWINLDEVSINGTAFSGYAWGADVVGWLDMSGVTYNRTIVAPGTPGTPTQSGEQNCSSIMMTFAAPTTGTTPFDYGIYRSTTSSGTFSNIATTTNVTSFSDPVGAGKQFFYKVLASNSAGTSWSLVSSAMNTKLVSECSAPADPIDIDPSTPAFRAVPNTINQGGDCTLIVSVPSAESQKTRCQITGTPNNYSSGTFDLFGEDTTNQVIHSGVQAETRYTLSCQPVDELGIQVGQVSKQYTSCRINPSSIEVN